MYKNILFDVDGTLLPMDVHEFVKYHFGSLCEKMIPVLKIEPKALTDSIMAGLGAMAKNDGSALNRDVFWKAAAKVSGVDLIKYEDMFTDYYNNEFVAAKTATFVNPYAKKCVDFAKENGYKVIAATNPIFPKPATYKRLEWAGLNPEDFEYITVYDNSSSCKPNLLYFKDLCEKCAISPKESLMVGNDVDEDLCSAELGFDTFLITDCIINRNDKDYSSYKNGSFEDFFNYLTSLAKK